MAPWLIFGAGGKGVGHQIAQLAIAEKRPIIAVVRNRQSASGLEALGVQVLIPQEQLLRLFQPWEVRKIT